MLAGPRTERFESLDMLRGVAVLGIFAINLQAMAWPQAVFGDPSLHPDIAQGEFWWAIAATFFQFKFITIFSALFGAGVILMVGEDKPSGGRVSVHYRRMLWLALFGVAHGFLIWYGDILLPYAFAGCLIVLARRWKPWLLTLVGFILIGLLGLLMAGQMFAMSSMDPEKAAEMMSEFAGTPEMVATQVAQFQGAFPARLADTLGASLQFELMQTLILAPRNIGVMMLGMALYKTGFFTLRWGTMMYLILGAVCLAVGIYGSNWSTEQTILLEHDILKLGPAQTAQYWASLPHSFGYACFVMLIAKVMPASLITKPFAAAGRMALSNYLGCSLLGFFLFYGAPGLGKIGEFTYREEAMTVLATWIAILVISPIWLSIFRFGPFEWLWRSLTYGKLQPLLK